MSAADLAQAQRPRKKHACFPEGRVGFAIGDIHGCADLLAEMLALIDGEKVQGTAPPVLVFLGDYVDRGVQVRQTLDLLCADNLSGFERRYLLGNHELSLLNFLDEPLRNRAWLAMGGLETMASYGVSAPTIGASRHDLVEAAKALHWAIPPKHMAFLRSLERYALYGDYAFVHAGINPRRPMVHQTDRDLLWNRTRYQNDRAVWNYRVVHGHTAEPKPYADDHRIGLDTGAYHSGRLSAVRLEADSATLLQVGKGDPDRVARARVKHTFGNRWTRAIKL